MTLANHFQQLAQGVYHTAFLALRSGVSVIPIRADGTKSPAVKWKSYQYRKPVPEEINQWFSHTPYGIAFITGPVSGGLEALDFDTRDIYEQFAKRMHEHGLSMLLERIEYGYLEETPDGMHLLYRCPESRDASQKLARKAGRESGQFHSLIETRGQGGYCIVAPTGGLVHPTGKAYRLLRGGVAQLAPVTMQERQALFAVARTFDDVHRSNVSTRSASTPENNFPKGRRRPGDLFNERVSWEALLPRYGWTQVRQTSEALYWRRPGKKGNGVSATTNYRHSDLLYVFSTLTCFEPECGYSKFSAYALLEHNGDFSAAARALAEQGYVEGENIR